MTYEAGQVWRWHSGETGRLPQWDELWLLLSNPHPNEDAWNALNLETGVIDTVFPSHATIDWKRVA